MKKKIISIILILLLTGCKVEYKIDLNNNLDIEENIKLISTTEQDKTKINDFSLNIPIDKEIDDYGFFEKKSEKLNYYNLIKNNETMSFNYEYDKDNYKEYIDSTLVNMAYEYISISKVEEDTKLILSTSKEFLLFNKYENLDEVKITINTKYKVLANNADETNRHNYTWIITKDNAYGKSIYLKLDTTEQDLTLLERIQNGEYTNIFTVSSLIFIIGLMICFIIKKVGDKRDKI